MQKSTITLVLLATASLSFAATAAGFGERCSSSKDCDTTKQLACNSKRCGCRLPERMQYISELAACVVRAEESGCVSAVSGGSVLLANCTTHSYCDENGIDLQGKCRCSPGYIAYEGKCLGVSETACNTNSECFSNVCSNGKCACPAGSTPEGQTCKVGFSAVCNEKDFVCDSGANLVCKGGRCGCRNGTSEDMQGNSTCLGVYGTSCRKDEECHNDLHLVCGDKMLCTCGFGFVHSNITGRCLADPCNDESCLNPNCPKGSEFDPQAKVCRGNYKASCPSPQYDCHPELSCINQECACNSCQVYDNKTKECRPLPGCSCTVKEDKCSGNSFCSKNDGICTCPTGLVTGLDKEDNVCKGRLGAKCQGNEECSSSLQLQCVKGSCGCRNGTVLDAVNEPAEGRQCLLPVGQKCKSNDECVFRSFCAVSGCTCVDGYVATQNGTCQKAQTGAGGKMKVESVIGIFLLVLCSSYIY